MELVEEKEKEKNIQQAAKESLPRAINAVKLLMDAKRSLLEVRTTLKDIKEAHATLAGKHEEYTMFLNDEEYTEAEVWMEECTREYTKCIITVNDYEEENAEDKEEDTASISTVSNEGNVEQELDESNKGEASSIKYVKQFAKPLVLKHEKPKLPHFHGDIHKYFIFKADFQQAVETHCTEMPLLSFVHALVQSLPSWLKVSVQT